MFVMHGYVCVCTCMCVYMRVCVCVCYTTARAIYNIPWCRREKSRVCSADDG